jgi:hypothetical protein
MPDDGDIILQIGAAKNLGVFAKDSEGEEISLVQFTYQGKTFGDKTIGKIPDAENLVMYKENIGLWLLYMDFKTDPSVWQILDVINPDKCNMHVRIVRIFY